jgi:hypothetical protein
VGRCGSCEPATLRSPVRLERTGHRAKGWTAPLRPVDDPADGRTSEPSASSQFACGLQRGRYTVDAAASAVSSGSGGEASKRQQRCPCASPHVLLVSSDAWRTRTGHPGTRRTQRAWDDTAIHAPEPRQRSMRRFNCWIDQVRLKPDTTYPHVPQRGYIVATSRSRKRDR